MPGQSPASRTIEDRIRAGAELTERGIVVRMSPQAIDVTCRLIAAELEKLKNEPVPTDELQKHIVGSRRKHGFASVGSLSEGGGSPVGVECGG